MRFLSILLAAALLMPTCPAEAQQSADDDWDFMENRDQDQVMAFVTFDTGLGLATRCTKGVFEALIAGLPPRPAQNRQVLKMGFGDADLYETRFSSASDARAVISELPAPFARKLRQGGRFRLEVPGGGEDGRTLRYDVQLPSSSASIDRTLTACDRPLVDPRDAELDDLPESGLPRDLVWRWVPEPEFPSRSVYEQGFAVISCLTAPNGRVRDCVVESEYPTDGGFGEAAIRGARGGRLRNRLDPEGPVPVARITYSTNFSMR